MKTKLETLLTRIDPGVTYEQVSARVDEALNSFPLEDGMVRKWEDFKTVLTGFHSHVEKSILRIRVYPSEQIDLVWGRCCRLLIKAFGTNGEKAAFEIARTGAEGGLNRILKEMARQMIDEYAGREAAAKIGRFWGALSADEKMSATDEYLKRYGDLLPHELKEAGALRIRSDFPRVLEEHPRLVKRFRKIGRNTV